MSALNGTFQVRTITDDNLVIRRSLTRVNDKTIEVARSKKIQRAYVVEPNVSYIKSRLRSEFEGIINNNKSVNVVDDKTKKEKK